MDRADNHCCVTSCILTGENGKLGLFVITAIQSGRTSMKKGEMFITHDRKNAYEQSLWQLESTERSLILNDIEYNLGQRFPSTS